MDNQKKKKSYIIFVTQLVSRKLEIAFKMMLKIGRRKYREEKHLLSFKGNVKEKVLIHAIF